MMKKTLAAALALLLSLCLLMGSMGVLAEDAAVEPEQEGELAIEIVSVEDEDEVFSAPVDETVDEVKDTNLWTEEIEKDVEAAKETEEQRLREEEAHEQVIAESVKIAKASFPDATFRAYIEDNFDTDYDGYLSSSEIADVTSIDYNGDYASELITSIEGVKVFVNLETLDVRYNALTKVDVGGMRHLDKLVLWGNQVQTLNVNGCTVLRYLDLDYNQLVKLNASGLSCLETVWARGNQLTSVNVSGTAISTVEDSETGGSLHIYGNPAMTLNLSNCANLGTVTLDAIPVTGLNISNCPNLTRLAVRQNQLKTLNLGKCPQLNYVSVYDNNVSTVEVGGSSQLLCAIDAGGHIDSDGDLCFTDCSGTNAYFDEGVKFTKNGSSYGYMVDGVYVGVKPTKVYFSKTKLTLKMGKTLNLRNYVKFKPANASSDLTWTSSKKAVATVSDEGVVTPVKPGTAKITVKTGNGKKATATITVKAVKPTKVTIVAETKTVEKGKTLMLKAKLSPSNAYSKLTWTSSKKSIATVSSSGKVTGKKPGKAKITVKTANGKKASVTIKVTKKSSNPVKYRALLIAQCNYTSASALPGCAGDTQLMYNMLNNCKGGEGGTWDITKKQDMSYSGFFSAIDSTFAGADDNDVSLLFYSGHGSSDGSLCAVPYCDLIHQSDIASKMKGIPGKIIIMYDSCHSGSGVYTYGEENSNALPDVQFDAAVVNAFAAVDSGILVDANGDVVMGDEANTGELRVANKFYVLTAARKDEYSWCSSQYSYFTKWACDGVGSSGHMPADSNYDGVATLNEMFNYISEVGDDQTFSGYHQHVQVYPRNSSFKMFKR